MAVNPPDGPGDPIPGAGSLSFLGRPIAIPVPATSIGVRIFSRDCILMGWSFRESTGSAGAIGELYDGGDANAALLGCLALDTGLDQTADQQPADAAGQGANANLTPSIGGAAGTVAVVQAIRIAGTGATAATEVNANLLGVAGGTRSYPVTIPAGAGVAIQSVSDNFGPRGLPASGPAQAITLNVPAFGAGNVLAEADITGFIQVPAAAVDTQWFGPDGIYVRSGIFLLPVQGSIKGTVYIRL